MDLQELPQSLEWAAKTWAQEGKLKLLERSS